jgi:hypothetical protein
MRTPMPLYSSEQLPILSPSVLTTISGGVSVGELAGIVAGGVLCVIVLVALVVCVVLARRRARKATPMTELQPAVVASCVLRV